MNELKYKGQVVEIQSKGKGHANVLLPDGTTKKVKLSDIEGYAATAKTDAKALKDKAKAEKAAAKAAKKEAADKAKAERKAEREKAAIARREARQNGEDDRLIKANLEKYVVTKEVKTESGRAAIDCGDEVGKMLRGASLDDVYAQAAKVLGKPEAELRAQYSKLNLGMQRMNLGNRIRGADGAKEREAKKAAAAKVREEKAKAKAAEKAKVEKAKADAKAKAEKEKAAAKAKADKEAAKAAKAAKPTKTKGKAAPVAQASA